MTFNQNIYLNRTIDIIGIVFLIISYDYFINGFWFWFIPAVFSAIIYCVIPSFREVEE